MTMHKVTHAVHPMQQSCNMLFNGIKPKNKTYSLSVLLPRFSEYWHLCLTSEKKLTASLFGFH